MQQQLTAGSFAKLCGTTKATLRWYRKIELLIPKEIGSNGYAYYGPEQLVQFTLIQALQKVGYSLEQVKEYNNFDNTDDTDFLDQQINQLDQEIRILQERRTFLIQIKSNQNQSLKKWGDNPSTGSIQISFQEAADYLVIPADLSDSTHYQNQLLKLQTFVQKLGYGDHNTIISYQNEQNINSHNLTKGLTIGVQVNDSDLPHKLEQSGPESNEFEIIHRPSGKYFNYLTSFALENDPNHPSQPAKINPMIQGQIDALKLGTEMGYSASSGLIETPITVLQQDNGLRYLFLEVSILAK